MTSTSLLSSAVQCLNDLSTRVAPLRGGGTSAEVRGASAEQLLYERWLSRDSWALRTEALPLIAGADPAAWTGLLRDAGLEELESAAWNALRLAQASGCGPRLLSPPDAPEAEWKVSPLDLYDWAHAAGVGLPGPFAQLAQYIMTVVKKPAAPERSPAAASPGGDARERVLGAALALLARSPAECRDEHGLVDTNRLATLIASQAVRWFDAPAAPMTTAEMVRLLDRWIE